MSTRRLSKGVVVLAAAVLVVTTGVAAAGAGQGNGKGGGGRGEQHQGQGNGQGQGQGPGQGQGQGNGREQGNQQDKSKNSGNGQGGGAGQTKAGQTRNGKGDGAGKGTGKGQGNGKGNSNAAGKAKGDGDRTGSGAKGATAAQGSDEGDDLRYPGVDTMALPDSDRFISYGASASEGGRRYRVPFTIHGDANVPTTSARINGDALPRTGAWVAPGSGVWAPAAFYRADATGRGYYLLYTATHRDDNGRKCIGVAWSATAKGPFTPAATPLVCPTKGDRWALDADVATGPKGGVWFTWRDGQRADGPESALSVMLLKFDEHHRVSGASNPRVIMRSNELAWAHYRDGAGVTVIENPALLYDHGWYLFYSGNSWPTNYYATGIAWCGARLSDAMCTPIPGPRKAVFAYTGPQDHLPRDMYVHGLPGNQRGPGAMAPFRSNDGQLWVTWNYFRDGSRERFSRTGRLVVTGNRANADFKVVAP
ncbi:family 43 glycosylhydrolase [Pedococcus bigeumensis]|nr:family 43 glycosylhydrolase [Pedococcus bigeumensis]